MANAQKENSVGTRGPRPTDFYCVEYKGSTTHARPCENQRRGVLSQRLITTYPRRSFGHLGVGCNPAVVSGLASNDVTRWVAWRAACASCIRFVAKAAWNTTSTALLESSTVREMEERVHQSCVSARRRRMPITLTRKPRKGPTKLETNEDEILYERIGVRASGRFQHACARRLRNL